MQLEYSVTAVQTSSHVGPRSSVADRSATRPSFLLYLATVLLASCQPSERPASTDNSSSPVKAAESKAQPAPAHASSKDSNSSASIAAGRLPIQFRERPPLVPFEYRNGEEAETFAILESLGGGVGLIDYDLDGDLDLFFPGGGSFAPEVRPIGREGAFYRQSGAWKFSLITSLTGIDSSRYYSHGVAIGDANNDGFPDLLITGYGGLQFYINQGDGTFSESTIEAGLNDSLWSSSAAWGDLNEDGFPDLYVAHYVNWSPENNPNCLDGRGTRRDVCPPKAFEPLPDTLYFGNGDGAFRDVSTDSGITSLGKGLGVAIADLDLDGHQDIYVANDTVPNLHYHNVGSGRFEEISTASGTAVSDRGLADGSMGIDVGDYNLDGLPDIWVSNYERETFALYRNFGNNIFVHASQATAITAVGPHFVGWGTVFFDVDCDGDEDVFVANGHVVHFPLGAPIRQRALLFENLNGKRFEDVAQKAGEWMSQPHPARGCAAGDLDQDGDLDLVVSGSNEPVSILENVTPHAHHWVQVRLIGRNGTRDASGARVTVRTSLGTQSRQIKGGTSYGSSGDPCLHVGLGLADYIDEIKVRWLSGEEQTVLNPAIDRQHILIEPVSSEAITP